MLSVIEEDDTGAVLALLGCRLNGASGHLALRLRGDTVPLTSADNVLVVQPLETPPDSSHASLLSRLSEVSTSCLSKVRHVQATILTDGSLSAQATKSHAQTANTVLDPTGTHGKVETIEVALAGLELKGEQSLKEHRVHARFCGMRRSFCLIWLGVVLAVVAAVVGGVLGSRHHPSQRGAS